jgi:hypothetical protein
VKVVTPDENKKDVRGGKGYALSVVLRNGDEMRGGQTNGGGFTLAESSSSW